MACWSAPGRTATPTLAKQVLRLGYRVYTEKPPAMTAQDAFEVARVAQETGLLCTTAFKKRYNIAYSRAKEWIGQFPEDDLFSISIDYCSGQFPNDRQRWFSSSILRFTLLTSPAICLAMWMKCSPTAKGLDAYAVALRFENGAVGSLNLSDGRTLRVPTEEVEITARGGNFMTIHNSSVWRITENEQPTNGANRQPLSAPAIAATRQDTCRRSSTFWPRFAKAARRAPTLRKLQVDGAV
jgi:predicted dehydrogenase